MDFVDLTEEQRAAVLHDGNLRLISVPGSGKTACIAFKVSHWIRLGVPPDRILCLTFTRAAAKQMRKRIESLVGEKAKGIVCGTFHSVLLRFLIKVRGYRDPSDAIRIIDEYEKRRIIERIILDCGFEIDPEGMVQYIELKKNDLSPPNPRLFSTFEYLYQREEIYHLYQCYLSDYGFLDFTEILIQAFRLMRDFSTARAKMRCFNLVCSDESHDLNRCQHEILRIITGDGQKAKIFLVGDPEQSIYSFRGADPSFMLGEFDRAYKDARTLYLTHNFRSSGTIVQAAASILNNRMVISNPLGEKITVLKCHDELDQSERVADIISDLIKGGVKASEICVLYRKNFDAEPFFWELLGRGIPFQMRDEDSKRPKSRISLSFLCQAILIVSGLESELLLILTIMWNYVSLSRRRNKVSLLSMHMSKGLEFECTFIVSLNDEKYTPIDSNPEEELRVFYVACTRAKQRLYLSYFGYPNLNLVNLIQENPDVEVQKRERPEDGEARGVSVFR